MNDIEFLDMIFTQFEDIDQVKLAEIGSMIMGVEFQVNTNEEGELEYTRVTKWA